MVGKWTSILAPEQVSLTLRLPGVPAQEGSAVEGHSGSQGLPELRQAPTGLKLWGFGARRLCVNTYKYKPLLSLLMAQTLKTIGAFMCTAQPC